MTDLDFIPFAYHARVSQKRRRRSQLSWGAAMLAAMGVWLWSHRLTLAEARERLEQSRGQWTELAESRRFLDSLTAERESLMRQGDVLAALNDPASIVVVLAEISGLQPDGALLTELAVDTADQRRIAAAAASTVTPPGVNPPAPAPLWQPVRPKLRVTGIAANNVYISDFTARLSGSPLFRDVTTVVVKDAVVASRRVRQFEVECRVLPEIGGDK